MSLRYDCDFKKQKIPMKMALKLIREFVKSDCKTNTEKFITALLAVNSKIQKYGKTSLQY